MTPIERGDLERDAWLREALRHAPDADAAPPATLTEAILKQARAAAATAPAPRPANPWSAAWAWLARPPVAAGFAGVMAATLVGLMWWDRPMDEAMPHPPTPELKRSAPAEAPAPTAATDPAAPAARAEAPNDVRLGAQGADAAARPAPSAPPASPARKAAPEAARRPTPAAASQQPSAVRRPEPEPFASERKQASGAPGPAPEAVPVPPSRRQAPAATAAPAPAAPAMAEATKDAAPPRERAITGAAQESRGVTRDKLEAASAAASRNLAGGVSTATRSPPAMTALRSQQDEATERTAPLADTLASVANYPALWSWQRGAGTQAMTPALQRWLMQIDTATTSRWRSAPAAAAGTEGSALRLYRAGELRATLHLGDDGVSFTPAGAAAPTARAALAPAAAAALKRSLDDAAP
jgi:hypothetical protein